MTVTRSMPLFPEKLVVMITYNSGHIGLSSSSGVVTTHVAALNDAYDPDITGTGHQPMGFDQCMAFFNHFCVTDTDVVVEASAATGNYGRMLIRQDAGSTPVTDIDRLREFGGNVSVALSAIGAFGAAENLVMRVPIWRLQGLTRTTMLADSSLRGSVAAAPAELSYLHVALFNPAGVTCTANINFLLRMRVVFMEPRTAALSYVWKPRCRKEPWMDVGPFPFDDEKI